MTFRRESPQEQKRVAGALKTGGKRTRGCKSEYGRNSKKLGTETEKR